MLNSRDALTKSKWNSVC